MSDLNQDRESLEIQVLEIDHSIAQSNLAKQRIELDKAKINHRLKQYEKSLTEIDKQIQDHETNKKSILQAISKLEASK